MDTISNSRRQGLWRDGTSAMHLGAWLMIGVFTVFTAYHTAQAVTASASARESAQQEEHAASRNDPINAALRHQEYDAHYQTMLRHAWLARLGFVGLAVGCFALVGYIGIRRIRRRVLYARSDAP